MNGIEIPKKKLTSNQQQKLKRLILGYGNCKKFADQSKVSVPSIKKASEGIVLSEQIINKLISFL